MVFSSYIFIFVFLPLAIGGYYLLSRIENKIYQTIYLILMSLVFYGYSNINYLLLIIVSILVNYIIALFMQKQNKSDRILKIYFIAGVLFNVLLLGYFKYYDFFVKNINSVFATDISILNIAFPLGISFFTFQQLSFIVSIYKREEEVGNFLDYATFVLFFPKLAAGPIVLYSEMIPQFKDKTRRYYNPDNFSKGIYIFVIGFIKKAVIADTLALFVNNGFSAAGLSCSAAWITSLSYTFQIYFDFSGYSDMAIGLGKMFNIDIPQNFSSPYLSESVTVFWRRWHITLGRALSTYVYKPLGGNRKGKLRTYINLFLTFLVSGIWHGAAWTFIIWGVMYGILVVFERITSQALEKIPKFIRIGTTFLIVNFLWVLFRAESFGVAAGIYKAMFNFSNFGIYDLANIADDGLIGFPSIVNIVYILGILSVLFFMVFICRNSMSMLKSFKPSNKNMVYTALLFVIAVIHISRASAFIYFNF